ncbi:MAG: segregation/condensation protein A [Gammaproteobacteria bacterium]|jgi:segregation and condensation protein A|nr:segregation/condensation protein A [Gammaproteobacteria bacterium]
MDNAQPKVTNLSAARAANEATIAWVAGEEIQQLPKDLYIPPEALEVFLETFEGPLDLLLYLIRRQNLDILQVKVSVITAQYMSYIELMQALELELAAEYLLMAAMLAEIKSRMLLPRPEEFDDEDDPRTELIRRLQEYEQIKTAAEDLNAVPRVERDVFVGAASKPKLVREHGEPNVDIREVLLSLAQVLSRAELFTKHEIKFEALSVRDRMGDILSRVSQRDGFIGFNELFRAEEGRLGVVVTFLAIMELIRESLVDFVQAEPFAPIHVRVGQNATQGLVDKTDVDLQYGGVGTQEPGEKGS